MDPRIRIHTKSSWFRNTGSGSVRAENWRLCTVLYASPCIICLPLVACYLSGRQTHANCTLVTASHIQHESNQREFACNWPQREYNLHATGGRSGTICMRLEATLIRFVCDWPPDSHHFSTSTPTTLPPPPTPNSDSRPLTLCSLCW